MTFFVISQDADWRAYIGCQIVSPAMNTIVVYLNVQSSYKRRIIAKYSCHKKWGVSVVKQLNAGFAVILKTFYSLSLSTVLQPIDLTICVSDILQFFFFCNLTVNPSRLLLCSWLKKRIDILYKCSSHIIMPPQIITSSCMCESPSLAHYWSPMSCPQSTHARLALCKKDVS